MSIKKQQVQCQIAASNDKFVHTKGTTGGLLNPINELHGVNSKKKSVPVIALIGAHQPKTNDELVALIESHTANGHHANCKCGVKSAGTIEDFAKNLYEAQLKEFAELNKAHLAFEYEDCFSFIYTLFINYSLQGKRVEDQVIKDLNASFKQYGMVGYKATKGSEEYDFKYGVDVLIEKEGKLVKTLQVKPVSYLNFKENSPVVQSNTSKNKAFEKLTGVEVTYLYYELDLKYRNYYKIFEGLEISSR